MLAVKTWLLASFTISGISIPHFVPLIFVAGAILEYALGRSKNPRLRSIAAYIMTGLSFLVKKTHITDIPKVGDAIQAVLNFVAPPPTAVCKCCNGTGIDTPPTPQPTEPPKTNG